MRKEIENQFVEDKLVKFDSYGTGAMDQGRMAAIITLNYPADAKLITKEETDEK